MSEWKAWTPEEDALLREVWKMEGALKLHQDKFPGRTINAIRFRGHRELGLPRRAKLKTSKYSWVQEVIDAAFADGFVGTVPELAEQTKASHQRVGQLIREGKGKRYYIVDWQKRINGCDYSPVWAQGEGKDAPKPKPMSGKDISVRYRANKKIKEGKINPFDNMIKQVTNDEIFASTPRPKRGAYRSRIVSIGA